MNVQPLGDHLIIKPLEEEEEVRGGIIIPDTAKEKSQQGEVIAVGPGPLLKSGERAPMDIKQGNRVLYGKYAGTEVSFDGEPYLVLREDDVLGIITD